MDISGEHRIPAPRQTVWRALNDTDVLRRCLPGCDSLEKVSETEFKGAVTAKVGPVKATFRGGVTLSDLDPPNGYTLSGDGQGAAAGFAKGSARVRLEDDGEGATILHYTVDAQVGGKIAQVGGRLIEGTVRKLSGQFFTAFGALLAERAAAEEATEPPTEPVIEAPVETGGLRPAIWVPGLIVVVGALLWFFTRG